MHMSDFKLKIIKKKYSLLFEIKGLEENNMREKEIFAGVLFII